MSQRRKDHTHTLRADRNTGVSRRNVLKGGAALGAAAASQVIGAPTIWAQEIKDIEAASCRRFLFGREGDRRPGLQGSRLQGDRCRTSTPRPPSTASSRSRSSVDIPDLEGWQAKLAAKRGVIQGIERQEIKEFDNFLPIFTKGELDGHQIPRQGISPYEAMYIEKPGRDRAA